MHQPVDAPDPSPEALRAFCASVTRLINEGGRINALMQIATVARIITEGLKEDGDGFNSEIVLAADVPGAIEDDIEQTHDAPDSLN